MSTTCDFCGLSLDETDVSRFGPIQNIVSPTGSISAHSRCLKYSANLFQLTDEGWDPKLVAKELKRIKKLSCNGCTRSRRYHRRPICPLPTGCGCGCANRKCRRNFHFPCAPITSKAVNEVEEILYLAFCSRKCEKVYAAGSPGVKPIPGRRHVNEHVETFDKKKNDCLDLSSREEEEIEKEDEDDDGEDEVKRKKGKQLAKGTLKGRGSEGSPCPPRKRSSVIEENPNDKRVRRSCSSIDSYFSANEAESSLEKGRGGFDDVATTGNDGIAATVSGNAATVSGIAASDEPLGGPSGVALNDSRGPIIARRSKSQLLIVPPKNSNLLDIADSTSPHSTDSSSSLSPVIPRLPSLTPVSSNHSSTSGRRYMISSLVVRGETVKKQHRVGLIHSLRATDSPRLVHFIPPTVECRFLSDLLQDLLPGAIRLKEFFRPTDGAPPGNAALESFVESLRRWVMAPNGSAAAQPIFVVHPIKDAEFFRHYLSVMFPKLCSYLRRSFDGDLYADSAHEGDPMWDFGGEGPAVGVDKAVVVLPLYGFGNFLEQPLYNRVFVPALCFNDLDLQVFTGVPDDESNNDDPLWERDLLVERPSMALLHLTSVERA